MLVLLICLRSTAKLIPYYKDKSFTKYKKKTRLQNIQNNGVYLGQPEDKNLCYYFIFVIKK